MASKKWQQQYLGQFIEKSEYEIFLENLALKYHKACDDYDYMIGRHPEFNVLINLNANEVFKNLLKEGNKKFLIGKEEFKKEIQNVIKRGIYQPKKEWWYDL